MKYHDYEFRVRYQETDQMGVVYYANYLVWFEVGRSEYCRAIGLPYTEYEEAGIFLPVLEANSKYKSSVKYDDAVLMRTAISEIGKTKIRFSYRVYHKKTGRLAAEGFTLHAFVNEKMRPRRVPEAFVEHIEVFDLESSAPQI